MTSKSFTLFTLSILLSIFSHQLIAQDTLQQGLKKCSRLKNDSSRLTCFDRLVPANLPSRPMDNSYSPTVSTGAVTKSAAPMTAAAKEQQAMDDFGLNKPKVNPDDAYFEDGEMIAVIAEAKKLKSGKMRYVLNNEQVWVQADSGNIYRFKVGQEVRIKPLSLGSYYMFPKGRKRSIRVKRQS